MAEANITFPFIKPIKLERATAMRSGTPVANELTAKMASSPDIQPAKIHIFNSSENWSIINELELFSCLITSIPVQIYLQLLH